jgi:hypothetical protein
MVSPVDGEAAAAPFGDHLRDQSPASTGIVLRTCGSFSYTLFFTEGVQFSREAKDNF